MRVLPWLLAASTTLIPQDSAASFDNFLREYADTAIRIDTAVPSAPDALADSLGNYTGGRPIIGAMRFPDGSVLHIVADVLQVMPQTATGRLEFEQKYKVELVPPASGQPSFPQAILDGSGSVTTTSIPLDEYVGRMDLKRADLNQVAFWLHELGYHGDIAVSSMDVLRLVALWAQARVEDTRKVAINLIGMRLGGENHDSSPKEKARKSGGASWLASANCPCVRPYLTDPNNPYLEFDAWAPTDPTCESAYSRNPPGIEPPFSCHDLPAGEKRQDVLLLRRMIVRRSGNRSFPDWKSLLFIDLEGEYEMPHVAVIPGDLVDSQAKRDAFLETLRTQGQFHFYDENSGRCLAPFLSPTTGQCVHDLARFGYRYTGREESDGINPGNVKCEWEYDWSEPRDVWYRGFVLHRWKPQEKSIGLLFWEGDEPQCYFGICNPDDPLALFYFNRADTEKSTNGLALPSALDLETVSIQVLTVSNCACPLDDLARTTMGTEICDGLDNDCDGLIDDATRDSDVPCGFSVGECQPGSYSCQSCNPAIDPNCPHGATLACVGGSGPAGGELCGDVRDNDCDGSIDEGPACFGADGNRWCPGESRSCGSVVGLCTAGIQTCQGNAWGGCSGIQPSPTGEAGSGCNGLDEDCNGSADEFLACGCADGATRPCGFSAVGECAMGTQTCAMGVWGNCVGAVLPQEEICDGRDNDCDGVNDNGISMRPCKVTCGGAVAPGCAANPELQERIGVQKCIAGAWERSCAIATGPEVCNGIDDDCDSVIDEIEPDDPNARCGIGACENTISCICQSCQPRLPQTEFCLEPPVGCPPSGFSCTCSDGIDNDCNGLTDMADPMCQCSLQGGGG